jgi:cytochrome c nitrite reductase small subunit
MSRFGTWIRHFAPPPEWQLPVIILLGILTGLGSLALYISNAASYLSDRPEACMNCHVMASEYATWQRGSHARAAVCNDCHVPHDNFLKKFAFKAKDGLRHATIFTLRMEPQVIKLNKAAIPVVQKNCVRCHVNLVENVSPSETRGESFHSGESRLCWECHRQTPHGRVNSLASTPYARVPRLTPVVPDWITKLTQPK